MAVILAGIGLVLLFLSMIPAKEQRPKQDKLRIHL